MSASIRGEVRRPPKEDSRPCIAYAKARGPNGYVNASGDCAAYIHTNSALCPVIKGGPECERRNFYWLSLPRWTKAVACPSGEGTGRPRNASSRCLDEAGRAIARYYCGRSRRRLRPCSGRPAYALSFPGARHFQAAYTKQLRPVSFHILFSLLPLLLRQLQILTARLLMSFDLNYHYHLLPSTSLQSTHLHHSPRCIPSQSLILPFLSFPPLPPSLATVSTPRPGRGSADLLKTNRSPRSCCHRLRDSTRRHQRNHCYKSPPPHPFPPTPIPLYPLHLHPIHQPFLTPTSLPISSSPSSPHAHPIPSSSPQSTFTPPPPLSPLPYPTYS